MRFPSLLAIITTATHTYTTHTFCTNWLALAILGIACMVKSQKRPIIRPRETYSGPKRLYGIACMVMGGWKRVRFK